jgi:para-nitrobenzyl esterase
MQRRALLQAVIAGLAASVPLSRLAARTIREAIATTRYGRLRGDRLHGIHVFKGIRYGADTGPRRFLSPLPPEPWPGIIDALDFGPAAPQRSIDEPTSEDCLFLNLWTPGLRDGGARPVMVYVHGGAYSSGSGSSPLYDGLRLCERGDVVVISLNHRLNALAHLYLGKLGRGQFPDSGNAGLLDLVLALQWVGDHALEFGGDPGNVTVFGQSGGGAKIATMMAMPAARGRFHRAATMSGQQVTAASPRAATRRAEIFLRSLGLSADRLDEIRTLPLQRLTDALATHDPVSDNGALYFGPVLDGRVLPRHPFYPDAPAQSAHIPMIIGNTRDETRAWYAEDPDLPTLDWEALRAKVAATVYVDIDADLVIAEYRRWYPHYSPADVYIAASTAGRSWRAAVIEAELRAQQGAPAFVYQLDYRSPLDGGKWGAMHAMDIPLVFDNIAASGSRTGVTKAAQAVADQISAAFIAFARNGDPSHPGIPEWRPYTMAQRETMVFDMRSQLVNDPRGEERQLFAKVPFIQRGTF